MGFYHSQFLYDIGRGEGGVQKKQKQCQMILEKPLRLRQSKITFVYQMSLCYMKLYNINTFRYCSALSLCLCTLCLISSILMPLEAVVGEIKSEPFIFIHPWEG